MEETLKKDFKIFKQSGGKRIGNKLYLHKSQITPESSFYHSVENARKLVDKNFKYEVVRLDLKNDEKVTFINSPDWDTSNEPIVGDSISINTSTGESKVTKQRTANQQIYHHKWLFVAPTYQRFSYLESQKRSLDWLRAKGSEKIHTKIGNSIWWDNWLIKNKLQPRVK